MASSTRSEQTPRARRAEEIARHAIDNARDGRTTVTLKLWVNPETGQVRVSSGEPNHPFPLIAPGDDREKLHAQLDAVLDAIDRLS